MKVILTGASGFVGGHIAKQLADEDHTVVATVRDGTDSSKLGRLGDRIDFFNVDDRSINEMFQRSNQPDVLVHTATCYGRKGETAGEIYRCNVLFPMELMEAAASINTKTFINTDTYWPREYSALSEYSLSKKQFLEWGRQFAEKRGMRFINVRLQHVFGPGDDPDKFVPSLVKSCLGDLPEIRLTDGTQKRDFVFILDVVSAYSRILACLGKMPTGYVELDVGRGVSVHVKDFARMICAAAGSSSELNFGVLRQREDEIMDSVADISPLRELGWEPRVGLEKGIAMTVQSFAGEDRND